MTINAIQLPRGRIPLVHDVAVLLGEVSTASFQNDASAKIFETSVYVLVLRRLRGRWNDSQLSRQREALYDRCDRLSKITSDSATVRKLREVAASAVDIITIGCLSTYAEANFQRQLCQVLGEPLITTVAHLYINQKLDNRPSFKTSFVLERICGEFAHLLFWHKVPKTRKDCKESIENWILDSKMRSLLPGRARFFEKRFQNRNIAPTVVGAAEILFRSKDHAASGHGSNSGSKVVSLGPSTLPKMESDFRDFFAIFRLLVAIEECTRVEDIESKQREALCLGLQMIQGISDSDLLTKIVDGLEDFEYQQPRWP
jgi:hypothetical protein